MIECENSCLGGLYRKRVERKLHLNCLFRLSALQNGVVVRKYSSTKDAAESIGADSSNICAVLKGRRKRTAGYEWRYAACGGEVATLGGKD